MFVRRSFHTVVIMEKSDNTVHAAFARDLIKPRLDRPRLDVVMLFNQDNITTSASQLSKLFNLRKSDGHLDMIFNFLSAIRSVPKGLRLIIIHDLLELGVHPFEISFHHLKNLDFVGFFDLT